MKPSQPRATGWRFSLLCIAGALLTYMSMYAFRKPLSAATFQGLTLWGMDYKILTLISQVAGYTCSKFLGIRMVSSMAPARRTGAILALVGVAWAALLGFALVPRPWNLLCLVINGLPLGMIFGIVISFLEGRRNTELLSAGLCISFITASGITKSVGRELMLRFGVSDFWMPCLTGLVFVMPLLAGVWLLGKIPPPSADDVEQRSERRPMSGRERRAFVREFGWGIVLSTAVYGTLTVFRDLRDNFAVEMWAQMGYGDCASVLATSELCTGTLVLAIVACMIRVTNHRLAFFGNIAAFVCGGALLFVTTRLFHAGRLEPMTWMVASGFGLYLCYICFHTMFFDRWIAVFRQAGNISFLILISDSFGYVGSVGVLVYKNFMKPHTDWLSFIETAAYTAGTVITLVSVLLFVYFARKDRIRRRAEGGPAAAQKRPAFFLKRIRGSV